MENDEGVRACLGAPRKGQLERRRRAIAIVIRATGSG